MESQKANRKRKSTVLPLCCYGSSCYQKNAEHHQKYRHQEKPLVETQNKPIDDSSTRKPSRKRGSASSPSKSPALSPNKKSRSSSKSKAVDEVKKPLFPNSNTANSLTVPSLPGKPSGKSPVSSPSKSPAPSPNKKNQSNSKSKVVEKVRRPLFPETVFTETVEDVLNSMPRDFFDFWKFCSSINKSKPEDAFSELGLHLVGVYDLLAKKLPKEKEVILHSHWRYFYDPPEFQTVVKLDGKDLHHIGYFRDDPSEKPSILASNSAALGPKLTLKGDNIFAAVHSDLTTIIFKKLKVKQKNTFSKILEDLEEFAKKKKYTLDVQSTKTMARNKKVVAKTFNGLGIVVPVKNNVGYRPLPDSDATIKSILKKIINTEDLNKRLEVEEGLDDLITNVQFANDECDYGMGLELGMDLFCFGHEYFHSTILHLLPLAYNLLKRPKYGDIIKYHLANRKHSDDLNDLIENTH